MPATPLARSVRSGDVTLAVREHGSAGPDRPTVVLVHGYPDRQDTWDALVARLPLDAWHVVTYDVRGAGASDAPRGRSSYRLDVLVDDLVAVLDAVRREGPVHLVAHDWGSGQVWHALRREAEGDPRLRGRLASVTTVAGFSLDHLALLTRRSRGRRRALAGQLAHSYYVGLFHVLPRGLVRRLHRPVGALLTRIEGLPRSHWGPGLADDAAHGVQIYRANVFPGLRRPHRFRTTVPVLAVRATRDRYLGPLTNEDLQQMGTDIRTTTIEAGHWAIVTRAAEVAALVREQVERS